MTPDEINVSFTADAEIRNVSLTLMYFFKFVCEVSSLYINTTFITNLKRKDNIYRIQHAFTARTDYKKEDGQVFLILYYIL